MTSARRPNDIGVALLTGGRDRPYVFGLTTALMSHGATVDVIGSDELDFPQFHNHPGVNFLNLRGNQRSDASLTEKIRRVLVYYAKLIRYTTTSRPKVFHILWNNKFETFDRTLLMLYYRLLGKRIALTAHNVNRSRRDSGDSALNRLSLRIQYKLADHIFVHTDLMKRELADQFGVLPGRITSVPFGINNAVPNTALSPSEAKQKTGLCRNEKTILFFGNIAPYKGLDDLVAAFRQLISKDNTYRLIISGKPKSCEAYWTGIKTAIREDVHTRRVILRADYIPDEQTELYFKAADVVVLPYRHVYQSGVMFLAYSFGLPVLAADVGSLRGDVVEGRTGFIFRPEDPTDLANTIERYFASELYRGLNRRRQEIRDYAAGRHSWEVVSQLTMQVYAELLASGALSQPSPCQSPGCSWPAENHSVECSQPDTLPRS